MLILSPSSIEIFKAYTLNEEKAVTKLHFQERGEKYESFVLHVIRSRTYSLKRDHG